MSAGLATGASQGPREGSFRRVLGGVKRERGCPTSKASRGRGAEEPPHVHLQEGRPGQNSRIRPSPAHGPVLILSLVVKPF